MFALTMAFGIYEAKTLIDYGGCAYICVTELTVIIAYLLQYVKIMNIFELRNVVDDLIEKSQ